MGKNSGGRGGRGRYFCRGRALNAVTPQGIRMGSIAGCRRPIPPCSGDVHERALARSPKRIAAMPRCCEGLEISLSKREAGAVDGISGASQVTARRAGVSP